MFTNNIRGMFTGLLIMLHLSACNGQDHKYVHKDSLEQQTDTPHVEVQVNKEYDEHGNLIAYDSTYSRIYKQGSGDPMMLDSIFKDFLSRFKREHPMFTDPGFNDLFFQDSLYHYDFFKDDFFRSRMRMNQRYMDELMAEMDSLKNAFFRNGGYEGSPRDNR